MCPMNSTAPPTPTNQPVSPHKKENQQIKNEPARTFDAALEKIKTKFRISLFEESTYYYDTDFDDNLDDEITFDEFLKINDGVSQGAILYELHKKRILSLNEIYIIMGHLTPKQNGNFLSLYQQLTVPTLIKKFAEESPSNFLKVLETQNGYSRNRILSGLPDKLRNFFSELLRPVEMYGEVSSTEKIKQGFKFFS